MINKYFNYYKETEAGNEQKLIRDFFTEAVQIYGIDIQYIVRGIENEDYLFHEDVLSSFTESYTIEMYLENFDGFEGDDMISNFGFQVQDRMLFSVSTDRFREETGMFMPNEGDLLWMPKRESNSLFEIKFVEDENQFYPIGTLPAFRLTCELFRYDNQEFETGIPEIDGMETLDLSEGGESPFADNDEIEEEGDTILYKDPNNPFGSY